MASSYYMLNLNNKHLGIHYSFYLSVCVKLIITKKKSNYAKQTKSQSAMFSPWNNSRIWEKEVATHSSILAWKKSMDRGVWLKSMGLHD